MVWEATYDISRALLYRAQGDTSIVIMPGWKAATGVQKTSTDTYTATLHEDWCIGSGKLLLYLILTATSPIVSFTLVRQYLESVWRPLNFVDRGNTYNYTTQKLILLVPNGGYVTGIILEVVKSHFSTSLAKQDQPHTIAVHVEFLRRTQVGPATFKVHDVKLGRQTSIVHVTMEQDGRQASAPRTKCKRDQC
jgi:hypothetical protein